MSRFRKLTHSIWHCQYHIVWVPKYRHRILTGKIGNGKHLGKPLTQTEEKVLKLVIDGKSNKEIASLLNPSKRTIEVHRLHIIRTLGAESLIDLVKRAATIGLVDLATNQGNVAPQNEA